MREIHDSNDCFCCQDFIELSQLERRLRFRCCGAKRRKWQRYCIENAAALRLARLRHIAKCRICFAAIVVSRKYAKEFRLAA